MKGRIDQVKDSQSGKTLSVLIGEIWYSTKSWEFRSMVGQFIDFDPSTSQWQGKAMHWINDYDVINPTADDAMSAAMPPTPPVEAYQGASATPPPMDAPQRQAVVPKDRDASIVAQALTKACTGPGEPVTDVWTKYITLYQSYMSWKP